MNWEDTLTEVLSDNDSLVSDVESLVEVRKVATEVVPKRRSTKVPNELVFRIKVAHKHTIKLTMLARNVSGQWFLSLQKSNGDILRKYHYQYEGHPNPNEEIITNFHKHFPTQKYPLSIKREDDDTWAYDLGDMPENFLEAVKDFCIECNIEIESVQERLNPEWFQ